MIGGAAPNKVMLVWYLLTVPMCCFGVRNKQKLTFICVSLSVIAEGLEFGNSVYSVSFDEEYQQKVQTNIFETVYILISTCEMINISCIFGSLEVFILKTFWH
jgi:hypothetical protein